jgi:hypothetical protein
VSGYIIYTKGGIMSIYSQGLRLYSKFVLPDGEPKPPVLVFTSTREGNLALGNLIQMLPMLKALENSYPTIICGNLELCDLLNYNFKALAMPYKFFLRGEQFNTSISNFLCNTTDIAEKIIDLRIPCRIGHVFEGGKYNFLYNYRRKFYESMPEEWHNNQLLNPFKMDTKPYQLKLPPIDITVPKYDILIQAHCSGNPSKDWGQYHKLIPLLSKKYKIGLIGNDTEREYAEHISDKRIKNLCGLYSLIETMHLINGAELVTGNDGGLLKVSDNLSVPSIQIFTKDSKVKIRCAIKGTNLDNPTVDEVVKIIKEKLK